MLSLSVRLYWRKSAIHTLVTVSLTASTQFDSGWKHQAYRARLVNRFSTINCAIRLFPVLELILAHRNGGSHISCIVSKSNIDHICTAVNKTHHLKNPRITCSRRCHQSWASVGRHEPLRANRQKVFSSLQTMECRSVSRRALRWWSFIAER